MTQPDGPSAAERMVIQQAVERRVRTSGLRIDDATVGEIVDDSVERVWSRAATTEEALVFVERYAVDRIRALARLQGDDKSATPSVLFVCVHNAGRSQMAAGWARALGGEGVDVYSGGSNPGERVNAAAVAAMAEVDVDISGAVPQPWSDEIVRAADVVVTMGCGDACPVFPGKRYIDWELDDPAGQPVDAVRPVRDDIESRVRALLAELGVTPSP